MATKDNINIKSSFNWLRREARGPTYISYSEFADRSACSFEFGDNGYAASCNYGGELLHMSAKDDEKGVIFAYGDFERTYYSSLARAQRQNGGQATFGLGIAPNQEPFHDAEDPKDRGSNLKLGQMLERGCFNYRWPFNEYALQLNEEGSDPREVGTCARVSFVKDDILYQVIRLEQGCRLEADVCHYSPWKGQVILSIGGLIKFGALSTDIAYTEHERGVLDSDCLSIIGSANQLDIRVHQLSGDSYDTLPLQIPKGKGDNTGGKYPGPYYVYANLPTEKQTDFRDRHITFIAEYRLRQTGTPPRWPEIPTSEDIHGYLGIDPYSEKATGVMWETIFLQREEKSNYFSELSEVNLVGRCVEKILTVDLVPVTLRDETYCIKYEAERPLALISNLFIQPSIDLEALFWKMRFLTKAYRFLHTFMSLSTSDASTRPSSDDDSDEIPDVSKVELRRLEPKSAWNQMDVIKKTVDYQMKRLRDYIERILVYLTRVFIQPYITTNLPPLASKDFQSSYYYVMMTIWYVVKMCEPLGFTWKWVDGMKAWPGEDCLLDHCLPSDNLRPEDKEKEKVKFLKWYHYASVLNLSARKKKSLLPKFWQARNLDMKVSLLEKDARRSAAAKLSSRLPYSAEDEILDRLGFLAEPLNAEFSKHGAGSVASITARRILDRDFTRYINPGRLPSGDKGPTYGPWEVHALCYHSRLLVENHHYSKDSYRTREQKVEDVEKFRRRISYFLNAEACVIPCWERTNTASFQSEATSVLATTLLGICQKDFIIAWGTSENNESGPKKNDGQSTGVSPNQQLNLRSGDPFKGNPLSREPLEGAEISKPPAIEWVRYKPPRQYHHENFFNSLEDTPELFETCHPNTGSDTRLPPRQDVGRDIGSIVRTLNECRLTIVDLKASMPGQWNSHTWQGYKNEVCSLSNESTNGRIDDRAAFVDSRTMAKKLSDSLVDQELQHRTIILSPTSSTPIANDLRLFWNVFHMDSRDCFINHDKRFPDFSCQNGSTWIARITLRSWSKRRPGPRHGLESQHNRPISNNTEKFLESSSSVGFSSSGGHSATPTEQDAPIRIPETLETALRSMNDDLFNLEEGGLGSVELEVSSVVLSTNNFGDFSQCTVLSDLLNRESQKLLGDQCKDLWEKFIHQPQTARCLVFLTILGILCEHMANDYRIAMDYLIQTFKIEKSFTLDQDLLKGTHALMQLKLGLWSLESLYKLHNSLVMSLRCIEEASTELSAQIKQGPGKRGEVLERMCQHSLANFERKMGQLKVLNEELNQKIKLNSRYKDSLSTILSLEDSRNSVRQNSTIQKLTYLTIGYLPIGLMTAIFAIPSEQNVLIPRMGLGGFVVSIVGLFAITFTVAVFIEPILGSLGKLTTIRRPLGSGGGSGTWIPSRYSRPSSYNGDIEQGRAG
ncbi:hypothetical protein F5Y04DRAFT_51599 [Hypomontagnella monticulosa]|nr:hypothetical protein F5Y04DRAFT_51599 [Hypomontagnella monticulosa]